jgi:response regulator RpfG family c-di-GMP phosphodiesterase
MLQRNEAVAFEDELVFADESIEASDNECSRKWKILIVDDDEAVHKVTQMVLRDFSYKNQNLQFINAYSGGEARQMITEHPDTALILLDVVMETSDAGLRVVRHIRETLKNKFVRIILRTGQPGQAPERQVITQYDINDYKLKSVLTDQALYTTVISALRTYRDMNTIEKNRKGLEQIIQSSGTLFKLQSLKQFATGVLTQITSLFNLNEDTLYLQNSGFTVIQEDDGWNIIAATGKFKDCVNRPFQEAIPTEIFENLEQASLHRESYFCKNAYIAFFETQKQSRNLLYIEADSRHLGETDKKLIDIFSKNVSVALDNIFLSQEVTDTQKEVIYTLGEVVESRSSETANHVRRVAEFSYLLALKAGMDENQAELLRMASPMHDVGKIAIPDRLLNKPGKLTPNEFEIIKTHTVIGHNILKHSKREIMNMAATIALQHHECWDGTGYPARLKGEDIHIFSRITALMDVFDALGYDRVYKKAWKTDHIVDFIKAGREMLFDPAIVRLFVENLGEFIEIKKKYKSNTKNERELSDAAHTYHRR